MLFILILLQRLCKNKPLCRFINMRIFSLAACTKHHFPFYAEQTKDWQYVQHFVSCISAHTSFKNKAKKYGLKRQNPFPVILLGNQFHSFSGAYPACSPQEMGYKSLLFSNLFQLSTNHNPTLNVGFAERPYKGHYSSST